jgi:hypothetical protein
MVLLLTRIVSNRPGRRGKKKRPLRRGGMRNDIGDDDENTLDQPVTTDKVEQKSVPTITTTATTTITAEKAPEITPSLPNGDVTTISTNNNITTINVTIDNNNSSISTNGVRPVVKVTSTAEPVTVAINENENSQTVTPSSVTTTSSSQLSERERKRLKNYLIKSRPYQSTASEWCHLLSSPTTSTTIPTHGDRHDTHPSSSSSSTRRRGGRRSQRRQSHTPLDDDDDPPAPAPLTGDTGDAWSYGLNPREIQAARVDGMTAEQRLARAARKIGKHTREHKRVAKLNARIQPIQLTMEDINGEVMQRSTPQPTNKDDATLSTKVTIPTSAPNGWNMVGGLDAHIRSLKECVILPMVYPEVILGTPFNH